MKNVNRLLLNVKYLLGPDTARPFDVRRAPATCPYCCEFVGSTLGHHLKSAHGNKGETEEERLIRERADVFGRMQSDIFQTYAVLDKKQVDNICGFLGSDKKRTVNILTRLGHLVSKIDV